jgi:hypothetical protein
MNKLSIIIITGLLLVYTSTGWAAVVGYWSFDNSGNPGQDDSGYGNDGTVYGATWITPGKIGGALSFDGAGDYVSVGDNATLDITNELTIEAWVRTAIDMDTNPQMQIVDKGEHLGTGEGYMLMVYNGDLYGRVNKDNGTACVYEYPDDKNWHHVVYTFKSGEQKLYIDGNPVVSKTRITTIGTNDQDLLIGNGVNRSYYWNGEIDEVRIYNHVVPEPATILLLGFGGLALLRKRKA